MAIFDRFAEYVSKGIAWIAYASLAIMMVFVGVAAVARALHRPIIGDIEIVQLCMVVLVAGSLAYTGFRNGHVEVGIIVDNLPSMFQRILDIISQICVIAFCVICAYSFIINFETEQTSILLGYKYYPLKILIIVGLLAWAIVALQKIVTLIRLKPYHKMEDTEE